MANFSGLKQGEISERLKVYGYNELPSTNHKSMISILAEILREPMISLLIICAVIYLFIGEPHESVLLFLSVFVVLGITFYQERRSTRALEALRDLSSPRALVIRDGQELRIPAREVVPGDILVVKEGDRIAADGELLETGHLQVDESLLTGESAPAAKRVLGDAPQDSPSRMIFSSTLVVTGFGVAKITATGGHTEIGKIGRSLEKAPEEKTRLQSELSMLTKTFGILAVIFSALVTLAYGFTRHEWPRGLLAGITAAIALLPEEFPVILTVFLALGAWRLSRRKVLVRQTTATENLGGITVLCVDKTGTLTQNQMTIKELRTATGERHSSDESPLSKRPEEFHSLIEYAVLASHKDPFDPMEKALRKVLDIDLAGTEHIHPDWKLEREYPLSPELLAMSCVWRARAGTEYRIAAKGAPEAIVDLCHLPPQMTEAIFRQVREMADTGLRVLAVAKADFSESILPPHQHDFDFHLIGLVGLADPIRKEVPQAISECDDAGIRVLMITGDYPGTAAKIAAQAGLKTTGRILSGPEIEKMSDLELRHELQTTNIFARMVPTQKLRIVNALKANGEIVGMTGDGVNDAPSLKWADVGIAMGGRGTDVAREASDIVILDDNFASIVSAIRLGRRIFANIKSAIFYVFAIHFPIAGLAIVPIILKMPPALFPVHIVFLELIIDPACTLVFESENESSEIMRRPPRRLDRPLFGLREILFSSFQGAVAFGFLFLLYAGTNNLGFSEARSRTMTFIAFVLINIGLIAAHRPMRSMTANRAFKAVVAIAFTALALAVLIPTAREVFGFEMISAMDLVAAFIAATAASGIAYFFIGPLGRPALSDEDCICNSTSRFYAHDRSSSFRDRSLWNRKVHQGKSPYGEQDLYSSKSPDHRGERSVPQG